MTNGKVGLLPHLATKNFFILRDRKVGSLDNYESNRSMYVSRYRNNDRYYDSPYC
jgi:hypothetical protein